MGSRIVVSSALAGVLSLVGIAVPDALAATGGTLERADCTSIEGWSAIDGDQATPIDVVFVFDAASGEPGSVEHPFLADLARDDLCAAHGCEHGFAVPPPLDRLDGAMHTVHAYADDGTIGALTELGGSPKTFTCPLTLPAGVRRKLRDIASANAWQLSPSWDTLSVSDGIRDSYVDGSPLPATPRILAGSDAQKWLYDEGPKGNAFKRKLDAAVLSSWELSSVVVESNADATLSGLTEGPALPARPIVMSAIDGALYLVDAPLPGEGVGGKGAGGGSGNDDRSDGSDGSGCSCGLSSSEGSPGAALGAAAMALGLAALLRRSRSSAPSSRP